MSRRSSKVPYDFAVFLSWPQFRPGCAYTRGYYAGLSLGEIDWEPTCNPFEAGSDDFKDYNAGYCDALEQVFERADS